MMIRECLRRNVACLFSRNSAFTEKSCISIPFSVLNFSTMGEDKPKPLKSRPVYEFLLQEHNFSPEVASRVDSFLNLPHKPAKCDSTMSYFKEFGFTNSELEKTLRYSPRLLLASVENTIHPKIKILLDLGFSPRDIATIISKEPGVLRSGAKTRLVPCLSLLKDLLGSYEEVTKALRKSGWLLMTNLEKTMAPNIKFLKSCGVPMDRILVLLNYLPRTLLYKPEVLRKCVEKVDKMGVARGSKTFVYAVGIVGAMVNGTWEIKLQAFRDVLGFTEEDILKAFRQTPHVFAVSENKMKKMKQFFLATGKYTTSDIVDFPEALYFSIEKRYKPRFEILAALERKHLIVEWPFLAVVSKVPDAKFYDLFVTPYLDDPEIAALYKDRMMMKSDKD